MKMGDKSMSISKLTLGLALLAAPFSSAVYALCEGETPIRAVKETEVRDQDALQKLRGNQGIDLQWNYGAERGELTVTQVGDVVHLSGTQLAADGKGKLEIDGDVLSIDSKHFIFRGRITMIDTPDAGRSCTKNGDSEFAITQNRKYWRMREFGWCDQLTDYIDIYF
jgi:hypothetical protein